MSMKTNFPNLSFPKLLPVDSAEITISTCFAKQADNLEDLKRFVQVYSQLFSLLSADDIEEIVNWFDGRPKSMFVTLVTRNLTAIQFALSNGLLDEETVIESAIRDHLGSQCLDYERIEKLMGEFITPEVCLRQTEDGRLVVDLDGSPIS